MTSRRSTWMTDDLDSLADLATAFFEKDCAPNEERWCEQQHVDREAWLRAGELGLLCASIPEAYGGGGGDIFHESVLIRAQVKALAPSFGGPLHSVIVAHYINAYGSEEQKLRWLPAMARGEMVGAVAMTEPGTGSDLQGVKTRAIREGDHYVVNGSKTFISNGALADLVIVVAKTDVDGGAGGISLVVVETADQPGFSRGRNLKKIGQHGQDTVELFFEDVRVPVGNLLGGDEGLGFVQLMQQLPQERLLLAVTAVAAMEITVDLTVDYVKQREAFGKPVFAFQNTKFTLAECATLVRVAQSFIDECVCSHAVGELDIETAAMAKWWLTEQQCTVVDECIQLFGGYGYMAEYPIARLYADARVQKIYGGTNEIMKELVARAL